MGVGEFSKGKFHSFGEVKWEDGRSHRRVAGMEGTVENVWEQKLVEPMS